MKSIRQSMILDIITQEDIETQEDLAARLRAHGMNVTQATLSRDFKELRLIKVLASDGNYKYATVDNAENGLQERFISIFAHAVTSIHSTGNLIVIKTMTGTANAASEAIDSLKWKDIVGTIAGDNTIFIAVSEGADMQNLIEKFKAMAKH
ncbi:MAG: arginine repressor [Clostridia bacterium]|nr:arginine repressor [Clostridia bacterium]